MASAGLLGLFETVGSRPGRFFATAAALGEAIGLLGPVGPALIFLVMIVAASIHIKNGVR